MLPASWAGAALGATFAIVAVIWGLDPALFIALSTLAGAYATRLPRWLEDPVIGPRALWTALRERLRRAS